MPKALYGSPHQKERRWWKRQVDAGDVRCARGSECKYAELIGGVLVGGLIHPGEPWDLDHDDRDHSRYLGPSHQRCNRATAGRRRSGHSRRW